MFQKFGQIVPPILRVATRLASSHSQVTSTAETQQPPPDTRINNTDHPSVQAAALEPFKGPFSNAQVRGFSAMPIPIQSGKLQASVELNEAVTASAQRMQQLLNHSDLRLDNYLQKHPLPAGMQLTTDGQHAIVYRAGKEIRSMATAKSLQTATTHPVELPTAEAVHHATDQLIQSISHEGVLDENKCHRLIENHQVEATDHLISLTWNQDTAEVMATNTEDTLHVDRAGVMRGSHGHVTVYKIPTNQIILPRRDRLRESECLMAVAIPANFESTCYVHPALSLNEPTPSLLEAANVSDHFHAQQEKEKDKSS